MGIGFKENWCSALEDERCKHGHATTHGCFGACYSTEEVIPICTREDKRFDEEKQVVTIAPWKG